MIFFLFIACPALAQEVGKIVSVIGRAEVFRDRRWQPVSVGEALLPGEVLRTGAGSRMAIQLIDESQLKINANSQLELKQVTPRPGGVVPVAARFLRTLLHLFSGEIWLRSYEEPVEIETLVATATIRGTELDLAIGTDNASRLAVLEGVVEFRNPQGKVLVAAGEQATAKVGEAPRKTVLLTPLDAVQWSLYYPGIVSYRDYPLSGIAPALLQERLTEAERRVASAPRDVEAIIELGEILFDLGRRTEARKGFERALSLAPDNPRARADLGWVYLEENEVQAALGQFRQAQPPTLGTLVGISNALYRLDRLEEALEVIAETQRRFPRSPMPWAQAALIHLLEGRVTEALSELKQALALDPNYALAYGLRSNIYLVQNQKERALQAAQQALAANPFSPSAYLDLSLVKQAEFKLEEALEAARKAVELDPDNAQALIQVSRLLFGSGYLKEAFKLAQQARQRAPDDPLVNTTWGFLQLAQDHVSEAIAAFDRAIEQDSTRGEPHLGRGLALFRRGKKLEAAVQEMGIATLLEPRVSLFHSYLGKAFYEVKRERLAQREYTLAKELDPHDPTPYLYDGILKESINRVVEAVEDLQKSIELNDNRGVYRSRFLLDQDLAARGAALGQIYDELGFQQLALVEGWTSVNTDPSNYSAHRLLADAYSVIPRHEIAQVSELLQSQLLQPINITPVQPQLGESKLFILEGAGPAQISLNEFNPLFLRDRLALQASGVVGNNSIFGDEVIQSGIWHNLSWSLGQFHYETEGFRENNDLRHNIYDLYAQAVVTPEISLQTEFRRRETEQGDLALKFDPDDFSDSLRRQLHQDTARLGGRFSASAQSNVLVSLIYSDREETQKLSEPGFDLVAEAEDQGYQAEAQYLFLGSRFNITAGVGTYKINVDLDTAVNLGSSPSSFTRERDNAYIYSTIVYPRNLIWTAGVSYDSFAEANFDVHRVNPKFGLQWLVTDDVLLRLAVFETIKPALVVDQTIEPTQVAGFNQFFDDFNGTQARRYGIGLDTHISNNLYGGAEASKRDLDVPVFDLGTLTFDPSTSTLTFDPGTLTAKIEDQKEDLYRAYLYWTPHREWAVSAEYYFEKFKRIVGDEGMEGDEGNLPPLNVETMRMPLIVSYFSPTGFFTELGATYVHQDVDRFMDSSSNEVDSLEHLSSDFAVLDASIGYRLPKRWGFITLEARNLLDEKFFFQDVNFQTSEPRTPSLLPDRSIFASFTLNY